MKRVVREPLKRNTLRGDTGKVRATEVAAYPISSYTSHNTWTAGDDNETKTGQLLKGLSEFSPSIQRFLSLQNDERVMKDKAAGAADQMLGKDKKTDASAAYESAYYQLKAEGDATDFSRQWAELGEQSDTMSPQEFEEAKQDLLSKMIKGDEHQDYLLHIVPKMAEFEAQANSLYTQRQLEAQDAAVKDSIAKTIYSTIGSIPADDPESGKKLAQTIHSHLERGKALGYTTKDLQGFMAKVVGEEAVTSGRPELVDAFKENYKGNSAYNSTLRPLLDDYKTKAMQTKAGIIKATKEVRDEQEKQWRMGFSNTVYTLVDQFRTNPKEMMKIRSQIIAAAQGDNELGFMLTTEQYKDLTDLVDTATSNSGAPEFTNSAAHQNALIIAKQTGDYSTIIRQFGWGLNADTRISLLRECLDKRKSLTTEGGQRYDSFVKETASDLEGWWKNTNVKTGQMHFRDGYDRSMYGRTAFFNQLHSYEEECKAAGKAPSNTEILKIAREVRTETDKLFDNLKKQSKEDEAPAPQKPGQPVKTATPVKAVTPPAAPKPNNSITARLRAYPDKK